MPVHHQQLTASTSASNDSTPSTSYNDRLKLSTSPDKLNRSLEKTERKINFLLKTKEESKIFTRERAFAELGLFNTSYPPKSRNARAIKL